MNTEQALIDEYIYESGAMFARLGDHLVTLDGLRDSHKQISLEHFGLTADPTAYEGNLQKLVSSHLDRFDTHMAGYLRYAHVVLAYIVMEDRLHTFGQLISETHRGSRFEAKGKGSLLAQFERYLSTLSIPAPQKTPAEALRLVRNCIVHCRGCLADYGERESLQFILPDLHGVTLDAEERLRLTPEGCLRLQEGVERYLRAIDSAAGFRFTIPDSIRKNFEKHILPYLNKEIDGN